MTITRLSWISALVMGLVFFAQTNSYSAETRSVNSVLDSRELPIIMKNEGIRKLIDLQDRQDLRDLMNDAQGTAQEVDPSCEAQSLSEVHIQRDSFILLAGYEVYTECTDTPSPALGLYYDVNEQFLRVLDLAN